MLIFLSLMNQIKMPNLKKSKKREKNRRENRKSIGQQRLNLFILIRFLFFNYLKN